MYSEGSFVQPKTLAASPYDAIADFYHRGWSHWYLPSVRPALERLFYSALPPTARILDVCCGCGHVTGDLTARGYQVTGIDLSEALIKVARVDVPGAQFMVADAREFRVDRPFQGALSTFDSLNHLLTYDDLLAAFRCVHAALLRDAPFFFDMNLEEAYALDLGQWSKHSESDAVGFVRGLYTWETRRARTELVWFTLEKESGLWERRDSVVEEQCYTVGEIRKALGEAGFRNIETYTATEAGVLDDLGYGRVYARAWA
jgi:SAM-dependent methyltransferase